MADPRFFARRGPFSLAQLAEIAGAEPVDAPVGMFEDVAPLELAGPGQVSFLDHPRYRPIARETRAGACLVRPEWAGILPASTARLLTADPYAAYARVALAFYPAEGPGGNERPHDTLIDPQARVHPSAAIGAGCRIAAGAVVEADAQLGPGSLIAANAVIGVRVRLGTGCRIGACASLSHCLLGDRVIVHAGARIGQDGFGFAAGELPFRVPQLGRVIIDDEVEIGANTTIDRGSGGDTVIGRGAKIDNLVQIAHNVEIGPGCIIVAQSGIAGSTRIGARAVLAAQTGATGHLVIGPGVRLAARAAATRDLPGERDYAGAPAVPAAEWRRQIAAVRRLARKKGAERR
jgi:UDP-3-O-[3-hydroxymyristoyl] glucosamine N-acyltransferase